MGISLGGMGSGLPPNIVEQLMEAERTPVKQLEKTKGKQENRLKLVTDLEAKLNAINSSLSGLASTRGFTDMKLTSGDVNVVGGTVDPKVATSGDWNVEVLSLAEKAAALTNGFPDPDKSRIGVGYFRFDTPNGSKDVYLNDRNNTLKGAVSAINAAGIGMKASILNDRHDPKAAYKLVLSSESSGGENDVKYPTLYFLDGDQDIYFEQQRSAKNGKVKLDGFDFEVGENIVKDAIPGVTIDLKQASPGRTVNISVKEDQEVVSGKIKGFVDAVNGVLSFVQSQNALSKESDTTQSLGGDGLLRTVENRIRALVQNSQPNEGDIKRISQLGVTFNRQGVLELDQKKFDDVLAKDPKGVNRFLSGDGFNTGFVPSVKRDISTILNSAFGPVAVRKKALQDRIQQTDESIANKERQLAKKEENLRTKFSRLEETMGKMKSQMGQIAAAPGANGNGG